MLAQRGGIEEHPNPAVDNAYPGGFDHLTRRQHVHVTRRRVVPQRWEVVNVATMLEQVCAPDPDH